MEVEKEKSMEALVTLIYLFILGRGLNNAFLSIVGKIKLLKTLKVKVTKMCNYQHMPFTCV